MSGEIFVTGIKATGSLHLGNYLGAIVPMLEMMQKERGTFFIFIADYHALTSLQSPQELKKYSLEMAASWLASGLDLSKAIFYRQSDIPEIFELQWILTSCAKKRSMNGAHAYKAAVEKNQSKGEEEDREISMGLYCYPILMAADILLFNATKVPVGVDQKQHVEIARELVGSFHRTYLPVFSLPQAVVTRERTLIGVDGRKMSKSYQNTIPLFCSEKQLRRTIARIPTDSSSPKQPKQRESNVLFSLYSAFASSEEREEMARHFAEGISWREVKEQLFILLQRELGNKRERYEEWMDRSDKIEQFLCEGAKNARTVASKQLQKVRQAIGVEGREY